MLDGTCAGPPAESNVSLDPALVGKLNTSLINPTVLNPDLFSNTGTTTGPTPSTDDGPISVTVTPTTQRTGRSNAGDPTTKDEGNAICTVRKQNVVEGKAKVFLLNPSMTVIYPGALLTASSIADGSFTPALTSARLDGASLRDVRNPLQTSISLMNVGKNTVKVDTPSLGSMRNTRNRILGRVTAGATEAAMDFDYQNIYSKRQLDVQLGAHYSNLGVDIAGKYDFSRTSETSKVLANFWQRYYDISISLPNPIANGIVSDSRYLRPNDVVVNNVSYGRLLYFIVESKYTDKEVGSALKATLNAGIAGSSSVDLSTKKKQVLKDTKVHITVLGGSASAAGKLISGYGDVGAENAILDWINRGSHYRPSDTPGAPIAYHTKYAQSLETANVYLTTTYTERHCRPKTRRFRVHNVDLRVVTASDVAGSKNTEEMYGDILVGGRAVAKDGSLGQPLVWKPVWQKGPKEFVRIREGRMHTKDLNVDEIVELRADGELDRRRSFVDVVIRPREHDGGPDDFQGASETVRWFLTENPSDPNKMGQKRGKFKQRFTNKGTEVEFSFDITPLPPLR
ncbi:MAG: thiol-activated cytolysin family protein [Salinigranum sp.]